MIKVQGHRGFSELYPENTIIAMQACYETGAHGIEMDVRVTADGEYIVMHDETLDRTTNGTGTVKFTNYYGYINTLDAGSWFAPEFVGTPVPTLDDVLQHFKPLNVTLVLQLYFTGTSMLTDVRAVVDKVVTQGMIDNVMFFAAPEMINEAKSYNTNVYTLNDGMATINTYQTILNNAIANGHDAVSVSSNASNADLTTMVNAIKAAGKEVHVSYLTSNYETRVQRFIDYDCDYILGNNPQIMQAYVDSVSPPPPDPPDEPDPELPTNPASIILLGDNYIAKSGVALDADYYIVINGRIVETDMYRLV